MLSLKGIALRPTLYVCLTVLWWPEVLLCVFIGSIPDVGRGMDGAIVTGGLGAYRVV